MLIELQGCVTVGNYIKFCNNDASSTSRVGEIIKDGNERILVRMFNVMSSDVMQSYFLPPIQATFLVPVEEVESGRFFLSCAENTFMIGTCRLGIPCYAGLPIFISVDLKWNPFVLGCSMH